MIVHKEKAAVTAAFLILTITSSSCCRDLVQNQATEPGCGISLRNLAMEPGRETTPPGYRGCYSLIWYLTIKTWLRNLATYLGNCCRTGYASSLPRPMLSAQPEISIPTGPSGVCSVAPPLDAALVPPRKACSHVSRSSVRYPRTSSIGPGSLLTLAVIRRSVQYS